MKLLILTFIIFASSFNGFCQDRSSTSGRIADGKRVNRVKEYYENGQLELKGKEKGKKAWVGCLGWRKVYKRTGRWRFYNQNGYLMKVVKYKNDREIKVIYASNRRLVKASRKK